MEETPPTRSHAFHPLISTGEVANKRNLWKACLHITGKTFRSEKLLLIYEPTVCHLLAVYPPTVCLVLLQAGGRLFPVDLLSGA